MQVANQIEVILNVPEHIFFLTVPNGFSTAVIDYLSSCFHKGDILFIPMGCHIMCVNVLPEKVLLGLEEKASPHDIPCLEQSVDRVMEVLHKFKRTFPTFTYRVPYEMDALAYEDSPFRNEAHEIIKKNAGKQSDIGKKFAAFQEGVSSFLAAIERHEHARSAHPIAEAMLDTTEDNHENPSGGNSTAKQFADLEVFFQQAVAATVEQYLWEREQREKASKANAEDESQ